MDLLATVRKEGSRGGQGDFKWSDVQNSTRREHYLGHSLMAPVGRWAKGRDLNWYAKAEGSEEDGQDPAERAARERKEEIKRIKEAEEDALARALGRPVPQRNNANMEPLAEAREFDKAIKDSSSLDEDGGKGLGYGSLATSRGKGIRNEKLEDADIETTTRGTEVEAAAEIEKGDTTNLIAITITHEDVETNLRKDPGSITIEGAPDHEVLTAGASVHEGIDHGHAPDLLVDHVKTIANDTEQTFCYKWTYEFHFQRPRRYPLDYD